VDPGRSQRPAVGVCSRSLLTADLKRARSSGLARCYAKLRPRARGAGPALPGPSPASPAISPRSTHDAHPPPPSKAPAWRAWIYAGRGSPGGPSPRSAWPASAISGRRCGLGLILPRPTCQRVVPERALIPEVRLLEETRHARVVPESVENRIHAQIRSPLVALLHGLLQEGKGLVLPSEGGMDRSLQVG
jgi:hypothetical protein